MGNPFKSLEKKIKKGLEDCGNSIKSSIRKVGSEAEWAVKKTRRDAENAVKNVEHQVEGQIKEFAHDTLEGLEKSAAHLKDEIEDYAEEAFEAVKEEALEVAQAAMKVLTSEALNTAVDAAQILMPSSISLALGPFGLSVDNVSERIDTLQEWAKNPPGSKEDIRKIIEEIAPSSVSINISVGLAFLVVQSESLELGIESTYETSDFLDKLDDLLKHYGINI